MTINEVCLKLLSNGEADSKLGDMAANVALQNFDYRYATLLFFNSTLYYGVELFLRVFNYNIIINRKTINSNLAKVTRQYVIFGSDVADLEELLDTLREIQVINTGKFIIVCESRVLDECDEKEMTKLLWEYKIVDAVFIKSENEHAAGYTYFPISGGNCNNVTPIKVKSSNISQYFTTNLGNIFNMKFKTLDFCPLFVSTFIQMPYMNITNGIPVGADGDLLRIIAYALNTSVKMMTPHRGSGWGFRMMNGTWMGSLADLHEDFANISMTSAALTLTRFSDYQMTRSYYISHVVWVTHPATLQNEALKLLHPLERSTQIALIVSFGLVILCAFVMKTNKFSSMCSGTQEQEGDQSSRSVVFYSWMICMGQSVVKLPTKSALLQITFLWIYYCFIIRTVYQVYLITSLKGKFYEDQFESIDDAIRANYPFGGGPALQDYYIDQPNVHKNWINVDTAEIIPTVMNIAKGKKFVLAMNWDTAKLIIKKNKISLHILPQKLTSSPTVIFFKKYSPLEESLNRILSRLIAAGFPEKFHQNYTSFKAASISNEEETLKIVHFTACYAVLIIGGIVSGVFFLLEIYFGKIYKHPMISP